jgi:hypothetical protein
MLTMKMLVGRLGLDSSLRPPSDKCNFCAPYAIVYVRVMHKTVTSTNTLGFAHPHILAGHALIESSRATVSGFERV